MSEPDAAPIRVVLAEDHALVRQGTRRILEEDGGITVVAEAADGEEAVAAVARHHPEVVVVDVAMPRLNGIEATRRIKDDDPRVAVLALTVHDEAQYVHALLEAGAAGYLLKDVGAEQLVQAVKAVHAGEAVLDPSITRTVLERLVHRDQPPHDAAADDELGSLTDREHEVLRLAAPGSSNRHIAEQLGVSVRTVETHLSRVFAKLGVGSRTEAVLHGLRAGWFDLDQLPPAE